VLNDLARPTRMLVGGFGLVLGLILGGPIGLATLDASPGWSSALLFGGLVLELVVITAFPLYFSRADRRLRERMVAATGEIARGEVEPVPAVARVVRRRTADLPWWVPGRGPGPGPSALTVLTALGDGAPRRVAALVPDDLGLHGKDVPAVLLLHPTDPEVAVLDDRVTHERLVEVDADPRWRTERLPSDRTVVGGYTALLAALAAGGAVGVGLALAVLALAT
jgi:hypothetical protein